MVAFERPQAPVRRLVAPLGSGGSVRLRDGRAPVEGRDLLADQNELHGLLECQIAILPLLGGLAVQHLLQLRGLARQVVQKLAELGEALAQLREDRRQMGLQGPVSTADRRLESGPGRVDLVQYARDRAPQLRRAAVDALQRGQQLGAELALDLLLGKRAAGGTPPHGVHRFADHIGQHVATHPGDHLNPGGDQAARTGEGERYQGARAQRRYDRLRRQLQQVASRPAHHRGDPRACLMCRTMSRFLFGRSVTTWFHV
ncbi:hypothetical protein ABZ912_26685 [Nonomuraea angiospora]|uniref:hypothetical protein n=1 Tax=Nonomuraea angiospora TaxID=46172 RepID=UPI0034101AEF